MNALWLTDLTLNTTARALFRPVRRGGRAAQCARLILAASGAISLRAQADRPGPTVAPTPATSWHSAVGVTVGEAYDSNVFLQDTAPDPSVTGAANARVESLVTTAAVSLGFNYHADDALSVATGYAPKATWFQATPGENCSTHRLWLNGSGRSDGTVWNVQNTGTWTEGSEDGPIYGGPGGVPAMGGVAVRDRRKAVVERSSFKVTVPLGPWFVRPVGTAYAHDFRTEQSHRTGVINYIDRDEFTAGADAGYACAAKTWLVAGLRYGRQDQAKLFGVNSPFDSRLRRLVVGLEGQPAGWLQLNLLGGPETRSFATGTPVGFDRTKTLRWFDTSAVVTPDKSDSCTLSIRRAELPSSTSLTMYEDIAAELAWRHRFSDALAANAGCKLARGDWQAPACREDRIFTPGASVEYGFNRHISLEVGYSYDRAVSRVPATAGREFRRQIGSVNSTYVF